MAANHEEALVRIKHQLFDVGIDSYNGSYLLGDGGSVYHAEVRVKQEHQDEEMFIKETSDRNAEEAAMPYEELPLSVEIKVMDKHKNVNASEFDAIPYHFMPPAVSAPKRGRLKKTICRICQRCCHSNEIFVDHNSVHFHNYIFCISKHCWSYFKTFEDCERHEFQQHGQHELRCNICSHKFLNFEALMEHKEKMHSKLDRIVCSVCREWFKNKEELHEHWLALPSSCGLLLHCNLHTKIRRHGKYALKHVKPDTPILKHKLKIKRNLAKDQIEETDKQFNDDCSINEVMKKKKRASILSSSSIDAKSSQIFENVINNEPCVTASGFIKQEPVDEIRAQTSGSHFRKAAIGRIEENPNSKQNTTKLVNIKQEPSEEFLSELADNNDMLTKNIKLPNSLPGMEAAAKKKSPNVIIREALNSILACSIKSKFSLKDAPRLSHQPIPENAENNESIEKSTLTSTPILAAESTSILKAASTRNSLTSTPNPTEISTQNTQPLKLGNINLPKNSTTKALKLSSNMKIVQPAPETFPNLINIVPTAALPEIPKTNLSIGDNKSNTNNPLLVLGGGNDGKSNFRCIDFTTRKSPKPSGNRSFSTKKIELSNSDTIGSTNYYTKREKGLLFDANANEENPINWHAQNFEQLIGNTNLSEGSVLKEGIQDVGYEVYGHETEASLDLAQTWKAPLKFRTTKQKITKRMFDEMVCSRCSRNFSTLALLKEHVDSDCGRKSKHECNVCQKIFYSKSTLNCHRTIHTGELPHECNFCHKRFRTRGQVTVHSRTHTGERPFICEICSQGFTHRETLIAHLSRHIGMKRYKCYGCGKTFSCISGLSTHRAKRPDTCRKVPLNTRALGPRVRVIKGQVIFEAEPDDISNFPGADVLTEIQNKTD